MENVSNKTYEQIVNFLAEEKVDQRISNSKLEHAIALLKAMFKHAKNEIRIYSGQLDAKCYSDKALLNEIKRFLLDRDNRVHILVQDPVDDISNHPLVKTCNEIKQVSEHGELDIRHANGIYSQTGIEHFAVMDDEGFRYEFDGDKIGAVANFNEPKTASALRKAFDLAFELAEKPAYQLKSA